MKTIRKPNDKDSSTNIHQNNEYYIIADTIIEFNLIIIIYHINFLRFINVLYSEYVSFFISFAWWNPKFVKLSDNKW